MRLLSSHCVEDVRAGDVVAGDGGPRCTGPPSSRGRPSLDGRCIADEMDVDTAGGDTASRPSSNCEACDRAVDSPRTPATCASVVVRLSSTGWSNSAIAPPRHPVLKQPPPNDSASNATSANPTERRTDGEVNESFRSEWFDFHLLEGIPNIRITRTSCPIESDDPNPAGKRTAKPRRSRGATSRTRRQVCRYASAS